MQFRLTIQPTVLNRIALICMMSLAMFGCTHVDEYKTFKPFSAKLDDGAELTFILEASADNSTRGTTVYGEPYKLMIFANLADDTKGLTLAEMSLLGENNEKIQLSDITRENQQSGDNNSMVIDIAVEKLEYQNYQLQGTAVMHRTSENASFQFLSSVKTDYKKENINKLWKNLMGI